MLSNAQKSLLKQAQRQAGIDDAEYRDTLQLLTGCQSSTDPDFSNSDLDKVLAYFEAVYRRQVDTGRLPAPSGHKAVLSKEGFWAARNRRGNTSRDRHGYAGLTAELEALEHDLGELGYGPGYCAAIKQKVTHGRADRQALQHDRAALVRTLNSKRKKTPAGAVERPF